MVLDGSSYAKVITGCMVRTNLPKIVIIVSSLEISEIQGNVKPLTAYEESTLVVMLIYTLICHVTAVLFNRLFDVGSGIWISLFLVGYVVVVFVSYYIGVFLKKYIPALF